MQWRPEHSGLLIVTYDIDNDDVRNQALADLKKYGFRMCTESVYERNGVTELQRDVIVRMMHAHVKEGGGRLICWYFKDGQLKWSDGT